MKRLRTVGGRLIHELHSWAEYVQFRWQHGGSALGHDLLNRDGAKKTALIATLGHVPLAQLEGWLIKALQAAGFGTVVLSPGGRETLRYYRLAGADDVITWADLGDETNVDWVDRQVAQLNSLHDWLSLKYEGVNVGRFAVATTMRSLRKGLLDFTDPVVQSEIRRWLEASVKFVLAGNRVIAQRKPDCIFVLDRGYAGFGELFDLALYRGIDALTWNGGYKSNVLFFKRYTKKNERDHHASMSTQSWARIRSVPWRKEYGQMVRDELFRCYQSQDWFSSVGTQFGKKIITKESVRQKLELAPGKKVAVIFPHILWDGSFFWGVDLFSDYTHWFIETMRAACANQQLEWVVKLHPSHVVKANKDNVTSRPSELDVIEQTIGALPPHVKLLYPESEVSTYSIFEIADYAITVRGTVGIEAGVFGIPVITAGTGRYSGHGFTIDSATTEEYLGKLRALETLPRLSQQQVELAERYAYGVFFSRPLQLKAVSLEFERDAIASWKVNVRCLSREDWLSAPDIRQFVEWISGNDEDMFALPSAD